ncbi:MAG: M28 family peptidase [Crocinitomicaceae bacterium]|nr:M28 family peptidase [Crocinitomicaceae bacterium]
MILTVFILTTQQSFAQKDYARQILDSLCSPRYDGRGYVNEGDVRSANFLVNELQRIGVSTYKKFPFEQTYQFNVNTFPYPISVVLDEDTLVPGVDYILDPSSGTAAGEFELVEINSKTLKEIYSGSISFKSQPKGQYLYAFNFTDIDDKELLKEYRALATEAMQYFPAIWVTRAKKTYSVGRTQKNYPLIEIDSAKYHQSEIVKLKINNKYISKYESKNVIGYLPGKKKNKLVVFTAHYDHLGRMGADTYFPGANDNASGCAMLLSLAKYYKANPSNYSFVFCFFSGEEAGLLGSQFFVSHPYFKLEQIKFLLNIDIMGAADKGITVVNGAVHEEQYNRLVEINTSKQYIPEIKKRGAAANSDHYFFSESGVPAFFIYSMGSVTNYHDVYDSAENTPLHQFDQVQQLIIDFVAGL